MLQDTNIIDQFIKADSNLTKKYQKMLHAQLDLEIERRKSDLRDLRKRIQEESIARNTTKSPKYEDQF